MPYCARINPVANVEGLAAARGRRDVPWALVTFSLATAVYLLTLSHDVGAFDVAEFQTIPHLFGVAHPTGYPLFTILGGLWSHIPFGSVAVRMNLFSAVLFGASASVACKVLTRLRVQGPIACAGTLIFAFATGTWRVAAQIDAQSLHLLLLAAVILLWIAACDDPSPRRVAFLCLALGTGLTHHGLMLLAAIPLLATLLWTHWREISRLNVLRVALPALIVPFAVLLYLPLRESTAPLLDANPERSWWARVLGDGFRGSMGQLGSLHVWVDAIGPQLRAMSNWVGFVALFLAVLGAGSLARRAFRTTVGLVAVGLLASYAGATSSGATERYLLGPVLVVALFAAVGADTLVDAVATQVAERAVTIVTVSGLLLFALLPLNGLRANYRSLDAHRSHRNEENGTSLLNALPTNCVLWTYWDLRTPLFYLRYIEGVRPDVTILDHRSTRKIGSSFAASPEGVYRAVTNDSRYTGRPVCFVPLPGQRASGGEVSAQPIAETDRPWGIGYTTRGRVYVLTARS